jgi:hypothetical protein
MNNKCVTECASWFPFRVYHHLMAPLGLRPENYSGVMIDLIYPSTCSVGGQFTGVTINEKTDVPKFPPEFPLVQVGSNYGEQILIGYVEPDKKPKTTKRGRKAKPKKPRTRVQGTGKYFNSQISFIVMCWTNHGKIYKFKLFRNGVFQVPGVLNGSQSDIVEPLNFLKRYFEKTLGLAKIDVVDQCVTMRNCKTILNDLTLSINTLALGAFAEREMNSDNNPMNINKVEYKTDQNNSKVVIKFLRPSQNNPQKQTTLKILKQKINFEGAVSFEGVSDIYYWLNTILLTNYYDVINDPLVVVDDSDSDDEIAGTDADVDEPVLDRHYTFDPYAFE